MSHLSYSRNEWHLDSDNLIGNDSIFRLLRIILINVAMVAVVSCAKREYVPFSKNALVVRSLPDLEARLKRSVEGSAHLTLQSIGTVTYENFAAPV